MPLVDALAKRGRDISELVAVDPFKITVIKVIGRRVGKVRVTWDSGASKPVAD